MKRRPSNAHSGPVSYDGVRSTPAVQSKSSSASCCRPHQSGCPSLPSNVHSQSEALLPRGLGVVVVVVVVDVVVVVVGALVVVVVVGGLVVVGVVGVEAESGFPGFWSGARAAGSASARGCGACDAWAVLRSVKMKNVVGGAGGGREESQRRRGKEERERERERSKGERKRERGEKERETERDVQTDRVREKSGK